MNINRVTHEEVNPNENWYVRYIIKPFFFKKKILNLH
jgi:hypothetical protein